MDMNANTQEQEEYPDMTPEMVEQESPDEPLGTQILRRVHQDSIILLEEYDEMITLLEHPKVKKFMLKKLERLAGDLEEIEGMFAEHYAEMQGLEGIQDMESNSPEGGVIDPGTALDDKEISGAVTDATDNADSQEMPLPSPEAAVEGMKKPSKYNSPGQKTLNSRKKSMCPGCGKDPCMCAEKKAITPKGNKVPDTPHGWGEDFRKDDQQTPSQNTSIPPHVANDPALSNAITTRQDGLLARHYSEKAIQEAVKFLEEIGDEKSILTHEGMCKAYRYHKILEDEEKAFPDTPQEFWAQYHEEDDRPSTAEFMRNYPDDGDPQILARNHYETLAKMPASERPIISSDRKDMTGGMGEGGIVPEGMEADTKISSYKKACHEASKFLKCLSSEKAFGNPHRAEALFHKDTLSSVWADMKKNASIATGSDKEAATKNMNPGYEPGEMGEKATKSVKEYHTKNLVDELTRTILNRESQMDLLTKKIEKLRV